MNAPSLRAAVIAIIALTTVLVGGLKIAVDQMLSRDPPTDHAPAGAAPGSRLASRPIIEVPSRADGDTLSIFYSGDNGWPKVDRHVSAALAEAGDPVVGVDALRYYMRERSLNEASADLAAIIDHYWRLWRRTRVVLVGYSFGADGLPEIVRNLPTATRARVRLVAMMAQEPRPSWSSGRHPGSTSMDRGRPRFRRRWRA